MQQQRDDWVVLSRDSYDRSISSELGKEYTVTGITRAHWVAKSSRPVCKTRTCRAKFTVINSPRNCYKCGDVFCKQCLKQSRKLNVFANYDPQGKFYKVCNSCFDSDKQTLGATRKVMNEFRTFRRAAHKAQPRSCGELWAGAEERIINGFLAEVNSTHSLVRMVQSLTVNFVKGAWKKSPISVANDVYCSACKKQFERVFRTRHQCSVCSSQVCESCSNKHLIVYIPDEILCKKDGQYSVAKIALIHVQGAPTVEPKVCEYLRVCGQCHLTRQSKQLADAVDGQRKEVHGAFWDSLVPFHSEMMKDQRQINESLEKYEILVLSLEDGSVRNGTGSNVQVLAKAQIDLGDLFYQYYKHMAKVKSFKPITNNSEVLLRNMQMSTTRQYVENRALFVQLKKSLEEYLPAEVVETIQNQVNKKALVCVHLLVKQLAFEVLSVADGQHVPKAIDIAQHLVDAEEVIGEELKQVLYQLEGEGVSWEDHLSDVNAMIRVCLQNHRLITLTTWQLSHPDYLLNELIERSCLLLEQINEQLNVKTTMTSHRVVKDRVQAVKAEILKLVCMNSS